MKKLIFLIVIAFLASCQSGNEADKIKEKIKSNKDKIAELNHENVILEKQFIELSGEQKDNSILVRVDTVKPQPFRHFFEASGTVESINEAFISPEISGQIKLLYVTEGQRVSKGQKLVKLSTSVTENNIEEVKTSLELAKTLYEKQKQLWDKNIGSEVQFLEAKNRKESLETRLKTLEAQLEMAYITSPIVGIVDEIFLKEGELAVPGVQIMQVVNLDELYINADIAERYLSDVKEGEEVFVTFPSYPNITLQEKVHRVGNVINPMNRTFNMQLKIKNQEEKLKPNILSIITINDYSTDNALVIPSIIVKEDMKGKYIYKVADSPNSYVAKKVYIETGISYKDLTEVKEGLSSGDMVITEGYNLISDGSEIKVK